MPCASDARLDELTSGIFLPGVFLSNMSRTWPDEVTGTGVKGKSLASPFRRAFIHPFPAICSYLQPLQTSGGGIHGNRLLSVSVHIEVALKIPD